MFQAPRRHFLRDTPRDWGEDGWGFLYKEKREGAEKRLGSELDSFFGGFEGDSRGKRGEGRGEKVLIYF